MKPMLIGLAGGSRSGNTTLARKIISKFIDQISFLSLENYYYYQSHIMLEERRKINYYHLSAFDFTLLRDHFMSLKRGESIYTLIYSISQYIGLSEIVKIEPISEVIVESLLLFWNKEVRELPDIKIYVDCDPDLRFISGMLMNIKERVREIDLIIEQYVSTVRSMHTQFVELMRRFADIIIPEGWYNKVAFELKISKISQFLGKENAKHIKA